MRFPVERLTLENTNRSGDWTDYEFTDNAPNGIRRLWVYSVQNENGWKGADYAMLLRSATDDGGFDHCDVRLPRKIVAALSQIIP